MLYTVSITSQGQISIPIDLRRKFGLDKIKRATVTEREGEIIIKPVKDLLELGGSFKTNKKPLTSEQIHEAFGEYLADEAQEGLSKDMLKDLGFKKIAPYTYAPPKQTKPKK